MFCTVYNIGYRIQRFDLLSKYRAFRYIVYRAFRYRSIVYRVSHISYIGLSMYRILKLFCSPSPDIPVFLSDEYWTNQRCWLSSDALNIGIVPISVLLFHRYRMCRVRFSFDVRHCSNLPAMMPDKIASGLTYLTTIIKELFCFLFDFFTA